MKTTGAGIVFSVVIVAFASVALYHPDPSPPPLNQVAAQAVAAPEPAQVARSGTRTVVTPERPAALGTGEQRPRSAFTTTRPGEGLADVAQRIYGANADVEALWLANRDQLAAIDAPLVAGTPLRTP